jgi:hypothetical protein
MYKVNERDGIMLISAKQHRCSFPGPSIPDVPVQVDSHTWRPRRRHGPSLIFLLTCPLTPM